MKTTGVSDGLTESRIGFGLKGKIEISEPNRKSSAWNVCSPEMAISEGMKKHELISDQMEHLAMCTMGTRAVRIYTVMSYQAPRELVLL